MFALIVALQAPQVATVAMLGAPTKSVLLAAISAFAVVVVFRVAEGAIGLELFGIKAKGAAAAVVLWVVCFAAVVAALSLAS